MKVTGSIFDRYELVLEHLSINECTNQGKKQTVSKIHHGNYEGSRSIENNQ